MNNQARASAPFPARTSALVRAPTPAKRSIPGRPPTLTRPSIPARAPTPAGPSVPARAPTPAGPSVPARAPTPAGPSIPARAPTPAGPSIPVRAPTPAGPSTPARSPTPVPTLAPVRFPGPVPASTAVRTPTPARTPIPLQAATRVRNPTAVPTSTPTSSRVPDAVSDVQSFPSTALPLGPLPEAAPAPAVWPVKASEPPPGVKRVPPVARGLDATREPLSELTLPASHLLGSTLGSTPRADPAATELTDPTAGTAGPVSTPPVLGTIPLATSLPVSANAFASTSEYFQVDNKIVIKVIYCYNLRYILLKKSLEQQFPNCLLFEEDISAQATGEFEVFVDGKLVHSKKKGDGFVDEARLQKIGNIISERIRNM